MASTIATIYHTHSNETVSAPAAAAATAAATTAPGDKLVVTPPNEAVTTTAPVAGTWSSLSSFGWYRGRSVGGNHGNSG